MNICIVGTGYVGLVAGVCFADAGHQVTCVDNDSTKINNLKDNIIPIYEPGLDDLLKRNQQRLSFTTDLKQAINDNEILFIAVGTPEKEDGSADLSATMSVINEICHCAKEKKFVVLKSTVPIGTAKKITQHCQANSSSPIEIINNPEFLKEGAAIDDFLKPDRVVVGCSSQQAKRLMWEIYEPFLRNGNPIYFMDNTSAEMTKYAANAFLSVKISFINELAQLADKIGADINEVRKGFTSDSRINPSFFHPGCGFGGSCFPKDVKELIYTGNENNIPMQVVTAADQVNDKQKTYLVDLAKNHFGDLKGKTIAIWGLSFKPRTDDVREAPARYIIKELVQLGAQVKAFDPIAIENAQKEFDAPFEASPTALDAVNKADALMLVTEWNEFRNPDFDELRKRLKNPVIFDGRNVFDPNKMKELRFEYYCIGRQHFYKLDSFGAL